ncbi:MAG: hypothetical protein ICV69_16155 [Thermoleophilaceae bacterium]|nr:hypothetical protein [Thermoleophilaceae bacterium]
MPAWAHDRCFEEQPERDRRYGLEHDEYAEFVRELELADRIADQALLPPAICWPERRHRAGSAAVHRHTSGRLSQRSSASPRASASAIPAGR